MDGATMTALMPTQDRQIFNAEKKKRLPCCNGKKKPQPWLEGTLGTEYNKQFFEKEVPQDSAKPKAAPKNNAKFDGTTTNQADYVPHQVAREPMVMPTHSQAVEGLPFQGNSAYAAEFGPKEVAYHRVKPNTGYEPNKGEFYGKTTYNGDFLENQVPVLVGRIKQPNSLKTSSGPFEGASVYKDNFGKPLAVKRESCAPKAQPLAKGKFDGETMYTASYVPKEVAVPEQVRPKDARPMSQQGWYGGLPGTEYGGQFFNKETPHVEPVKATRGGNILGKGPFDGSTTNKADYTAFQTPMKDRMIRPNNAIEMEKLPFNGESTYAGQYVSKDVPYARVKASNAYVPNGAAFDGTTTSKVAYRDFGMVPTYRGKPQRSTAFDSKNPFEGQSTYNANYAKMPSVPRTKAKGMAAQPLRTGPFDGVTTYRGDFVEKEIPAKEPDCRECDSCEEEEDKYY
eukprot:gene12606-15832_t